MADVSDGRAGDDRGQIIIVSALLLAVTFVALAVVFSTAIYTETLSTRDGTAGPRDALSTRQEVANDVREAINYVNVHNAENESHATLVDDLNATVDGLEATIAHDNAVDGRSLTFDLERAYNGTRILQEEENRTFTSVGGATNWTLTSDAPGVRRFRMDVARQSLYTGASANGVTRSAFNVTVENATGATWTVYVFDRLGNVTVLVEDPGESLGSGGGGGGGGGEGDVGEGEGGGGGSLLGIDLGLDASESRQTGGAVGVPTGCSAAGDRVSVRLVEGTVGGTRCPELDFLDPSNGTYAVSYGNGDRVNGTYELFLNGTTYNGGALDEPRQSPYALAAIYAVDVSFAYRGTGVEYDTTVHTGPKPDDRYDGVIDPASIGTNARPVVADVTYSPGQPWVTTTVQFTGDCSDPDGYVVSCEWDFDGDGTTDATGENVSHEFAEPGYHEVTLTATDDEGATANLTRTVTVGGIILNTATAAEASDPGVHSLVNASIRNVGPGDVRVTGITVWANDSDATHLDADDWTSYVPEVYLDADRDNADDPFDGYESADATWYDSRAEYLFLGDHRTLDRTGTLFAGENAWAYLIEFQNRNGPVEMRGRNVTMRLDVEYPDGTSGTRTLSFVPQGPPEADFEYSPREPWVGEPVTFEGTSLAVGTTVESREWDFDGDGTTDATGEQVEHTFDEVGTHEVTLTITTTDGRTDTRTKTVDVGGLVSRNDAVATEWSTTGIHSLVTFSVENTGRDNLTITGVNVAAPDSEASSIKGSSGYPEVYFDLDEDQGYDDFDGMADPDGGFDLGTDLGLDRTATLSPGADSDVYFIEFRSGRVGVPGTAADMDGETITVTVSLRYADGSTGEQTITVAPPAR